MTFNPTVDKKVWRPWILESLDRLNRLFPATSIGTYPGHDPSEHDAADLMIPSYTTAAGIALGDQVAKHIARAAFCREQGIHYIIWRGRIWSMTRPESGWLPYFDRNNANPSRSHKNHNHISWYLNRSPVGWKPEPMPMPAPYTDGWHPDLPWVFFLDRQNMGVKLSESVWILQKALGLKPYDGIYTQAIRDAVAVWQRDVLKDDPVNCDGILGSLGAAALFGPDVDVIASSAPDVTPVPAPKPKPKPVPAVVVPPVEPTPKPTPVPVPVPVPREPTMPKLVITLDAPGAGNWQGAVQNSKTGQWYIAEAQTIAAEDREDTMVHHFDAKGAYLDSMRLMAGKGYSIHATSFGVSDSDVIWISWNEATNDVVTLQYMPGATVTKTACQAMHVFEDGTLQIGFSPTREWCVLRRVKTDTEVYRRHTKQNILDGIEKPYGVPIVVKRAADRTVQGFTVVNEFLYILTGRPSRKEPTKIAKYSFDTGQLVSTTTVTLEGEPEGMDGRYFGLKRHAGTKRRLYIYRHGL